LQQPIERADALPIVFDLECETVRQYAVNKLSRVMCARA
jgi:hypothetical protein